MTEDDLRARLRTLEESQSNVRADVAGLKSDVRGLDRDVRQFAPALKEFNETKETANKALALAKEIDHDRDEDRSTARFTKWQVRASVISIAALLVSLAVLVFLILTFAGASHAGL